MPFDLTLTENNSLVLSSELRNQLNGLKRLIDNFEVELDNATARTSVNLFFFQAEDGIRDGTVTGVQTCLFRSIPPKMVPHAAKFFPMVRGVRKAIFSGARSLTTILFPAIPPRPAGLLSQAQNTSRRKKRVRFRKSLDFRFRGATPSRFSKT